METKTEDTALTKDVVEAVTPECKESLDGKHHSMGKLMGKPTLCVFCAREIEK